VKAREQKHTSNRLIWGAVVAVLILGVIGLKIARGRPTPTTPAAQAAGLTMTAAPKQPAEAQTAPAADLTSTGPAPTATNADPFPAHPAAQIGWIERNRKPAMILFHSTNCIPCKAMDQLVKKVRADYEPEVVFVDVITNDRGNEALIQQAGIQAIPTTFFVAADGQGKRFVGAMQESALRAELETLRAGG